ncbi:MAG: mycothiol transferase [Mycobacteriales bacterium]
MAGSELLTDAFGRIREAVHAVTRDLTAEELSLRLDPDANSIAWLVWHLTRVQDDHLADAAEIEQAWVGRGWQEKFDLPFPAVDTGYGHSSADVAAVRVDSSQLLTGYYDAVHEQTIRYVRGLGDSDLFRIVDERWDPPVTLGVRLISVISDDLQHAGQAAFIRGSIRRR